MQEKGVSVLQIQNDQVTKETIYAVKAELLKKYKAKNVLPCISVIFEQRAQGSILAWNFACPSV